MSLSPAAALQLPYLRLHQAIYQLSRGWVGRHVNGHRALLLTTKGRRTGKRRTNGLIYAKRGHDLIVVASNSGRDRDPGWCHNLRADPVIAVQIGRRHVPAAARIAEGDERKDLWELANKHNRGLAMLLHRGARGRYDVYQTHTARTIPVVVLTPVE
jgi:F420H(2)-dependent quinone reductase